MSTTTTRTLSVRIDTPYDESPDLSWLEQTPAQLGSLEAAVANKRRLLAYERGDWHLIGVRLVATIELSEDAPGWHCTNDVEVETPGVWGVESDSDDDYIRSIACNEADEYLRGDLLALSFTAEEIDAALEEADLG